MIFDFSLVLVVLAFLSGLIWGLDHWVFARRRAVRGGSAREPVVVDYARSFFPVILLVLVLRSFLYEPFRIPSDSMMPTLIQGDFIFVNKWGYGLRLPVLNWKAVAIGEPQRGDVIVFRKPTEPSVVFIKRLVGLPGDTIRVASARVYVNGNPVPLEPGEYYRGPKEEQYPFTVVARERLGEAPHGLMFDPSRPDTQGEWTVPEGHYFMMGDNRNNSRDSRFPEVGFVPADNLIGKAVAIWLSFNPSEGPLLLWDRMATRIN
jgi:signal peptidase I